MNAAAAWLKARKTCTLDTAFKDLRDYIECYVTAANEMATGRDKNFPFELERGSGIKPRFVVRGFPFGSRKAEDAVKVEVVLNDSDIAVSYPDANPARGLQEQIITQKWNPRTETCMLWLNGEEWTNQQISQMIVDPLFFQ